MLVQEQFSKTWIFYHIQVNWINYIKILVFIYWYRRIFRICKWKKSKLYNSELFVAPVLLSIAYTQTHTHAAKSLQLCLTLCDPRDCHLPASSVEFSRQEYGRVLPFPLPGIFLTQGSNPCLLWLLHCIWILYHCTTGEVCICVHTHTHMHVYLNICVIKMEKRLKIGQRNQGNKWDCFVSCRYVYCRVK